jgi:cobalt-zinc-cadmium efflux system outer membrane protein
MLFTSRLSAGVVLVMSTFLVATGTAGAGAHEPAGMLTLRQAVDKALASNPAIEAAGLTVDVQRAARDVAALGTQYQINTDVQDIFGTGVLEGFDGAETTVQLARTVELGNKRRYREELGNAQVAQAELGVTQQLLDVAAEVSRRYAQVLRSQQRLTLASETLSLNERTLDSVTRRYEVGRASEADRAFAQVAVSRVELIAQRLRYELDGEKARLAAMWAADAPDFSAVAGDLFRTPQIATFEQLADRLEGNVSLLQLDRQVAVNEAGRRLAESAKSPNLQLSGGVRHFSLIDETAFVVSFGIPLGNARRADPQVRSVDARATRLPLDRRSRELELRTQLYVGHTALLATRGQLDGLRERVLPEAEKAVTFYQRGYEIGSNSLLELLAAQQQLLEFRSEVLDLATQFHLALIDIETLLGNDRPGEALQ